MANISYTFTDLSDDHSHEQPKLHYTSSINYNCNECGVLHSHNCTEIFYVIDGEGLFCTDDSTIPLHKDQMIIVNPKVHHTEHSSKDHKMHYVVLGIENLQFHFGKEGIFLPYQSYSITSHTDEILNILSTILKELKEKKNSYGKICEHYLSILLLLVKRITGQEFFLSTPNQIPYECQKARAFMDAHFKDPVTLDHLATLTHWDKFYFSHQFSKSYGISPINYLLNQRIEYSKQLLRNSDSSITEIAEQSGFSSQNYFSQTFRKNTGISPREYRNKNSK